MNSGTKVAVGLAALVTGLILNPRRKTVPDTEDIFPSPRVENARQNVVDVAMGEVGQQDPAKYWRDVMPPGEYSAAQIESYAASRAWCGGFALWCLKQAGVAPDLYWKDGLGFCYQLPVTKDPQPGDIAYFDQPYQHHAIVVQRSGDTLVTVDGNQAQNTVAIRDRSFGAATAYYSIADLVSKALA